MTTLAHIREVLKNNEAYFRGFGFTEVGVFGSYVRGEATPESDVDILLGSDDSEAGIGWDELAIYDTLSEQLNDAKIDIAIKRMLFPKLRENILAEVEYIVGPPEVMAHNRKRRVKLERDYTVYLDRMIEYMEQCKKMCDITFEEFTHDNNLILSGMKRIEIIGGAANRIPDSLKEKYAHLEIPWNDMIAMSYLPCFGYDKKSPFELWKIITEDFPKTLPKIQEMHRPEEQRMKKIRKREKRERAALEG